MNVLYALRRAKAFHGDRIAVYDGDRTLTYAQFYDRALRAGNVLRSLGVKRGDRVAVLMLNSPAYLEMYYATALIGAVVVPINTRWNQADIAFILEDSGSSLLVLDDRFADLRSQCGGDRAYLFAGRGACPEGMADYAGLVEAAAADGLPEQEPDEQDLVGLFYTSGTTGGPKGVMLTHRNVWANACAIAAIELTITPEWTWLHAAPMFHLADQWAVYCITLKGGAHAFLPTFDPEEFLRGGALSRNRHDSGSDHDQRGGEPSGVRPVRPVEPADDVYGASPMPLDLLRRAMATFPVRFSPGLRADGDQPDADRAPARGSSAGHPAVSSVGLPVAGVGGPGGGLAGSRGTGGRRAARSSRAARTS